MEQQINLTPILAEASPPMAAEQIPPELQEEPSTLQKLKAADERRPGFPGEHWLVLGLGIALWQFTRRHRNWVVRTAGGLAASALVARAASGREGLSKVLRYPPFGRRSSGGGSFGQAWPGVNYRATVNDNMLVVVMIETLEGVANAEEIAATHGVDAVILGNNDLSSFSGWSQNDPRYQDAIIKVHNAALKYGKFYGNAGAQYLNGYTVTAGTRIVQNGPASAWVRSSTRTPASGPVGSLTPGPPPSASRRGRCARPRRPPRRAG